MRLSALAIRHPTFSLTHFIIATRLIYIHQRIRAFPVHLFPHLASVPFPHFAFIHFVQPNPARL